MKRTEQRSSKSRSGCGITIRDVVDPHWLMPVTRKISPTAWQVRCKRFPLAHVYPREDLHTPGTLQFQEIPIPIPGRSSRCFNMPYAFDKCPERPASIEQILNGLDRYNPETTTVFQEYVNQQCEEKFFDCYASLALLKLYVNNAPALPAPNPQLST